MTNYTVNAAGLAEIAAILAQHSKAHAGKAPDEIPSEAVNAYASDAEEAMGETGDGRFEIRGMHAVGGNPLTFFVTDAGFDAEPSEA